MSKSDDFQVLMLVISLLSPLNRIHFIHSPIDSRPTFLMSRNWIDSLRTELKHFLSFFWEIENVWDCVCFILNHFRKILWLAQLKGFYLTDSLMFNKSGADVGKWEKWSNFSTPVIFFICIKSSISACWNLWIQYLTLIAFWLKKGVEVLLISEIGSFALYSYVWNISFALYGVEARKKQKHLPLINIFRNAARWWRATYDSLNTYNYFG